MTDVFFYLHTPEYAEITVSPGAGHYRRRDSEVGCGLKRSLSARHREGIHAGYPNALIAPVDTLGQSLVITVIDTRNVDVGVISHITLGGGGGLLKMMWMRGRDWKQTS